MENEKKTDTSNNNNKIKPVTKWILYTDGDTLTQAMSSGYLLYSLCTRRPQVSYSQLVYDCNCPGNCNS